MKRKTSKLLIIFILFTLFSATAVSPTQVYASEKLNYTRPNGPSPFKFQIKNFLNPQMISSVVGCTGVVNKISKSISLLLQTKEFKKKVKEAKTLLKNRACYVAQKAQAEGEASISTLTLSAVTLKKDCLKQLTSNPAAYAQAKDQIKQEAVQQKVNQCLNGIAISLAKNQLVQMTRSTMNWITTGFQGDPMYVRNINDFIENISDNIQLKELDMFKDADGNYNTIDYPYGRSYSISAIRADQSAKNIANSLKQDLTGYLPEGVTIKDFSKDFSRGGWSGWLALTQHPQNNPLGFTALKSEDTSKKKIAAKTEIKEQLDRSGGILDQKVCKKWSKGSDTPEGEASSQITDSIKNYTDIQELAMQITGNLAGSSSVTPTKKEKVCLLWETVTPGSLIKDKISTYINSPERQLELAKTINDSLNTLFGALVNKFRFNGLSSLGTGDGTYAKVSGGFGSNSLADIVDVQGNTTSLISATPSTGGYKNDKFDLTKDLGNTYYHVTMKDLGTWDASKKVTNSGEPLYIDTAPYDTNTNEQVSNAYYTVSEPGDTLLFREGHSVWDKGDKAYFDGTHWQNWKKDTSNPIAKRGIFQIQQDYIVVAKDLLKHLPGILPKIGELDYCIPGPNPNWGGNYSNNYKIFSDFVGSINTNYKQGSLFKKKYVTIDPPTGSSFTDFKDMYNGTGLWSNVKNTSVWKRIYELTHLKNPKRKGNKRIGEANQWIDDLNSKTGKDFVTFSTEYKKIIDKKYGPNGLMQRQFIEHEETPIPEPNTAWLPMSSDGLKITKNILQYNEDVTAKAQEYKDAIAQANLNIYKLKQIGSEVSSIIKAAQDRRDKKLKDLKTKNTNIEIVAGEDIKKGTQIYSKGTNENGDIIAMNYNSTYRDLGIIPIGKANTNIKSGSNGKITRGNIKDWTIPALCKDEENIDYIDNRDLITDFNGKNENRCSDGLDNDLDGLIDAKDPDCGNTYGDTTNDLTSGGGTCSSGLPVQYSNPEEESYDYSPDNYSYPSCGERTDRSICLDYTYYNGSELIDCNWTDNNSSDGSGNNGGGSGTGGYYGQYNFNNL